MHRNTREALAVYRRYTPAYSPWSPWVKPILFQYLPVIHRELETDSGWGGKPFSTESAWIIDLPEPSLFAAARAAVRDGLRPVPLFNGVPGDLAAIDVKPLAQGLLHLSDTLRGSTLPEKAPPVFLLDSRRDNRGRTIPPGHFDNRWMIFPQDVPSARFLMNHGVKKMTVMTTSRRLCDDLNHVLYAWQQGGLQIRQFPLSEGEIKNLSISRPLFFGNVLRRWMVLFKFRRSSAGGFGSMVPYPSEGSHGMG